MSSPSLLGLVAAHPFKVARKLGGNVNKRQGGGLGKVSTNQRSTNVLWLSTA